MDLSEAESDVQPTVQREEPASEAQDELQEVEDVGIQSSESVKIASTEEVAEPNDPFLIIQLGDRVIIQSTRYGETTGTVYYRSGERISVKPDGVSNTLHNFEVDNTDEEAGETFAEEDGVTSIGIGEKRESPSFVVQQDFRVGYIIVTYDIDGKPYKTFEISKIDKENDQITLLDPEDPEQEKELHFDFTGIDSDEPFRVIRVTGIVQKEEAEEQPSEIQEAAEENDLLEQEEDDDVQLTGISHYIPRKVFKQAAAFEQRIPDHQQKIDALNNFISVLDPSIQRDPKTIRAVRQEMETFFNLKQDTIFYRQDGSIQGPKPTSASTLAELIQSVRIPLGRPVLRVQKKEYTTELDEEAQDGVTFEDFDKELEQMIQNQSAIVSASMIGSQKGSIVQEWLNQQNFLQTYATPWSAMDRADPRWNAFTDSEFFRWTSPEAADEEGRRLKSVVPGYLASKKEGRPPIFDMIPFGMERALSTTYRKSVDRIKDVLLPEESATMESYLIFPSRVVAAMGPTRSDHLATDSGRSQMPPKTMSMILQSIGAPKEIGTSNDLILLDVVGNTLGNIPLSSYIDGIAVPALGLGDTFATLGQYGMDQLELNEEMTQILLKKITAYQSQLISSLAHFREMIKASVEKEPTPNPFLESPHFLETIQSQPMLVEDLIEYEKQNPSLSESDLGKVGHLMKKHPDYFQIAGGKSVELITQAEIQAKHSYFLEQLAISNRIKYNLLHSGTLPKINPCHHVRDMVAVRRNRDDSERFMELSKVFRLYQGARKDNWINCMVCKENLLCVHERLQLQAFLNPKEKPTIEKEIILTLAGGQFQGKYICRNCGQPIRDLDFDSNLEFDDNGRPKSGQTVLIDEDADIDDVLDDLLIGDMEGPVQTKLELDESQQTCYTILRDLSSRVGISLDNDTYRTCITGVTQFINQSLSTRADYGKKDLDYDIYVLRFMIAAAAIYLLLEVQTKIPPYVVRYALAGCESPGFEGYPLDTNPESKQGLTYIACAISSYKTSQKPWSQTGFSKIADDRKRQDGVLKYMMEVLKKVGKYSDIQARLDRKRAYQTEVLGKAPDAHGSRIHDMIPATFLPEQIILTAAEAAEDAIQPEVMAAMGNKGAAALVKLWIRQSHAIAKESASLSQGSTRMLTTCCTSSITDPGSTWRGDALPEIPGRMLRPNQQGSFLLTEFHPRPAEADVVEPDKELYFRLFLKYCFTGERKGYPHEPGLTHKCPWCNFQFPTHPSVMDTDTEGKGALAEQTVKMGEEEFVALLDTIHQVNHVTAVKPVEISPMEATFIEMSDVMPPVLPDWKGVILHTSKQLTELRSDATIQDIAAALSMISESTYGYETEIFKRFKTERNKALMEEIVQLSWVDFFKVLQNYFITPIQRLLSGFSKRALFVPIELRNALSEIHVEEGLEKILAAEFDIVTPREEDIKKETMNLARSKLQFYLKQLSAMLPYKNKLRPILVPGREYTLVYFQRAIFYGTLGSLIDPAFVPIDRAADAPMATLGASSILFLLRMMMASFEKYKKESLSFNDKQIKDLIAVREERERVNVVAQFNKLDAEQRKVEVMQRKLGIGKWAVGGTKVIYSYDKDYYDQERNKRMDAGLIDFPGLTDGPSSQPSGEDEDGYDHGEEDQDAE